MIKDPGRNRRRLAIEVIVGYLEIFEYVERQAAWQNMKL